MEYTNVFSDCLRELERDRGEAARLLDSRKKEVYEKIPRIKEIDELLSQTGLNLTKSILSGFTGDNLEKHISGIEKENSRLMRERGNLLKENGFKGNYLTDVNKCKACGDTGYVENEKCRCLKQKLISRFYGLSNLNNTLKTENFDHFEFKYYSEERDPKNGTSPRLNMQNVHDVCIKFVANFDKKPSNLLFYGETGLGKTFLCNAIAKALLDQGKSVLYATSPQLFRVFENYRFHREEMVEADGTIDMIYKTDLLIIDDLGTEFTVSPSLTELFNILNTRLLESKPMIISTNLNPTELELSYSERIFSRLMGHFTMCKFFGQDIRLVKKYTKKSRG